MKLPIIILFVFFISLPVVSAKTITVPAPLSKMDKRKEYFYSLVKLIIQDINSQTESKKKFKIGYSPSGMNLLRIIKSVEKNQIDLMWSMTTKEREEKMNAIKIPIMKNFIGYRVCLISKKHKKNFYDNYNEFGIKGLIYTQGRGWPDVDFLKNANLKVKEGTYKNLFELVRRDRAHCFPRSILELDGEIKNTVLSYELEVERSFALKYDAPMYFFLNKENIELKNTVESSLKRLIENGKFNQLFNKYFRAGLEKYNHKDRKVYQLDK